MTSKLSPVEIKKLREESGLTQQRMADLFGYSSVRTWQKKEETGNNKSSLSVAEQDYFLLLMDKHPKFKLVER